MGVACCSTKAKNYSNDNQRPPLTFSKAEQQAITAVKKVNKQTDQQNSQILDAGTGGQTQNKQIEDPEEVLIEMQPGNQSFLGMSDIAQNIKGSGQPQAGAVSRGDSQSALRSSGSRFPKFDLCNQEIPLPQRLQTNR